MSIWRLLLVLVFFLTTGSLSYAQTQLCGALVVPAGFYGADFEEERTLIENCANPFDRSSTITDLLVQGEVVDAGQVISVTDAGINVYGYAGENYFYNDLMLYRHEGSDYVATKVDFVAPNQDQVTTALRDFFGGNQAQSAFYQNLYYATDAERHLQFFNEGNGFDPIMDAIAGDYVFEIFNQAKSHIEQNVVSDRAALLPGTYTAVRTSDDSPPVQTRGPLGRWLALLIPTAHAAVTVETVTFTLKVPEPTPTGVSSVLFLPGIMGSRLYEESGECSYSGDVEVRERWLEVSNCDLLRLETNFLGKSINNIFTFADERGQLERLILPDVYDSFIDAMESCRAD